MKYGFVWLSLIGLVGCGGSSDDNWTKNRPATYPVTGMVIYKGNPLPNATVVFSSQGENPTAAVGRTDEQGAFSLTTFNDQDGAVAGEHQVLITATKIKGPPPGANLDEVDPTVTEISLSPQKFGEPGNSGLSATVTESGPNQFFFDVTE